MNFLSILFGWFLGVLSTLGYDRIKKYYEKEEFKNGVFTELKEIRSILAGIVFILSQRYGAFNRDLLNWIRDISIEDPYARPKHETIEKMLKFTDEQIEALAKHEAKMAMVAGSVLKKCSLPFLDNNMNRLSLFGMGLQRLILQIRGRLTMLNQDIDSTQYYFQRTFDSTLSPENEKIIRINLTANYERIMENSRDIADKITYVIQNF